ncbi:MAG: bacteriocin immunity protein [Lachnospiraceae bacterium]|nr:bacteriocin immunity protein [Lachnospiraceae bacterium]
MKKKVVLLLMSITCCAMLSACGGNNEENTDPLTGQEQTTEIATEDVPMTEQAGTNMTDEFDSLLGQPNDANGVIDYINTNIANAGDMDVDRYLTGLLGYGDNIRDIDFTRLEESRQHMPEDMVAFMELMKLEAESPSMTMSDEENRMTIGLTLSEMLERAVLFEQHIEKYPNNVSTEAASRLYEEIATNAITGGYDKTAGVPHYYQGETENVVDQESLSYYQQFAEANPDSRLGQLVQEYVTLLQENQFQINEELENFYRSLPQRLQPATEEGQTEATQDNSGMTQNGETGTQGSSAGTQGGSTRTQGGTTGTQGGNNGAANDSSLGGSVAGTVKDAVDNVMDSVR